MVTRAAPGHDPVAAGEELVQRPVRGPRAGGPGRARRAIHVVSTAIASPLAEAEPREPDHRRRRSRSAAGRDGRVGGDRARTRGRGCRRRCRAPAMSWVKLVRPEDAGERPRHDVRAGAVAPLDEALGDERVGGGRGSSSGRRPSAAQVALARQAVARRAPPRRARGAAPGSCAAWNPRARSPRQSTPAGPRTGKRVVDHFVDARSGPRSRPLERLVQRDVGRAR